MRKSETLMIRIDPDLKRRSESAARRAGRTLSAFVLHAIERETHHVEKREQRVVESTPKSFSGVPTFLRAALDKYQVRIGVPQADLRSK